MANEQKDKADGLFPARTREEMLERMKTAESVWLPRDVFESLYLSPEKNVSGDLRKTVRCPTSDAWHNE